MLCDNCRYCFKRKLSYGTIERFCAFFIAPCLPIHHEVIECNRFEPAEKKEEKKEEKIEIKKETQENGSKRSNKESTKKA